MTDLAGLLWEARRSGGVVHLDNVDHPKSSKEAYAIQHEIAALCGQATRGFKVGSTSMEAQRLLGTNEPGSALLLAPYVYESPAKILIEPNAVVRGEGSKYRTRRRHVQSRHVAAVQILRAVCRGRRAVPPYEALPRSIGESLGYTHCGGL